MPGKQSELIGVNQELYQFLDGVRDILRKKGLKVSFNNAIRYLAGLPLMPRSQRLKDMTPLEPFTKYGLRCVVCRKDIGERHLYLFNGRPYCKYHHPLPQPW